MDDSSNLLLQGTRLPARYSRYAVASFASAVASLAGLVLSPLFYPFVYLHLLFPVAIVSGHVARRQMRKRPMAVKGVGMATFGLWIGYIDLFLAALALWRIVAA